MRCIELEYNRDWNEKDDGKLRMESRKDITVKARELTQFN